MSRHRPLLILAPSLLAAPGGIQTLTRDLVAALESFCSCRLIVITKLDAPKDVADYPRGATTEVESVGGVPSKLRSVLLALKVLLCCVRERPALMIVVHRNHSPIALFMHRILGLRYVCMLHGIEAWDISGRWHRWALKRAVRLWCISQVTIDRAAGELGISTDRFELLPCVANEDRFALGERPIHLLERHRIRPDAKIVLTVARLASIERSKGYDRVLEALPELIARVPEAHYVLVGKGDDTRRVGELIARLGLEQHVTLAGFVGEGELPDYYRLCHVFALPSTGEGFGIVFLEALLSGKPCVGGADDGSREPLRDGALGRLVRADDRAELVEVLVALLTQPTAEPQWLRDEAVEHFGYARYRARLAEAVERLLLAKQQ